MSLRPLLFLAFAGLLLLPDWSNARPFRARRFAPATACPPAYSAPPVPVIFRPAYPAPVVGCAPPVVYSPPVTYAPPVTYTPVVSAVACPPAVPAPAGPTVVPERMAPPKTTTGDPKAGPSVIRTGGAEERLPPVPVPMTPVELAMPRPVSGESQKPEVKPYPLTDLPPLGLDKPGAPPKPAALPAFPTDALGKPKEAKPDEPLPRFDDLPPLPPTTTTVKSSPLSADAMADIYPVAGRAAGGATRTVGFINKSDREVRLTVGGKPATLKSGEYIRMELPARFRWQLDGDAERETTVPDTAPGVDVLIRK